MGQKLSSQEVITAVEKDLGFQFFYFHPGQGHNACFCAIPEYLSKKLAFDGTLVPKPNLFLKEDEKKVLFQNAFVEGQLATVTVVSKDNQSGIRPKLFLTVEPSRRGLDANDLEDYLNSLTNTQTLFPERALSFQANSPLRSANINPLPGPSFAIGHRFLEEVLQALGPLLAERPTLLLSESGSERLRPSRQAFPNLVAPIQVVETEKAFYFIEKPRTHTLRDILLFSSPLLSSDHSKLFITYQLLKGLEVMSRLICSICIHKELYTDSSRPPTSCGMMLVGSK